MKITNLKQPKTREEAIAYIKGKMEHRKINENLDVVRTKTVVLKPETVDEAILQMNLIGHMFYMFRNAETDNVCVVYRRNDGGYGLIEPDFE